MDPRRNVYLTNALLVWESQEVLQRQTYVETCFV